MSDELATNVVVGPVADAPSRRGSMLGRYTAVSDTLGLAAAYLLTGVVVSSMHGPVDGEGLVLFVAALPAWLVGVRVIDERAANSRIVDEFMAIGRVIVIGTWGVLAIAWLTGIAHPSTARVVVFAALALTFVTLGRATVRPLARRRESHVQNAVIVGAGEVGQLVARKLSNHPEYGVNLVGFVDTPPKQWRRDIAPVPVLGPVDDLAAIVREHSVDRVIVAFSQRNDSDILAQVRSLARLNVRVDVVPRLFEIIGPGAGFPDVEGIPLVSLSPRTRAAASLRVKRAIDFAGACVGLVLAAPVFLWAAWRIPRETPGPVFFRQTRIGANMEEFTMIKFRTMEVDADQSLHHDYLARTMNGEYVAGVGELYKLDRKDVITPAGRWLRRTSLDELPQLINVLRGNMSLVGPRPCLAYEMEYFAPHHYERFMTPAGITGLWQVTARGHASFAEALEMDVRYVRSWSLGLDMSLILRTPVEVLRQRKATV